MPKSKKRNRKPAADVQAVQDPSKRNTLRMLGTGALATAGLGGAAWFGVSAVRATAAEMDLTRIGQGKPTVVQVHDPQCALCTQLQREARKALKCFGECDLVYLVANVRGDEGRSFAARHGVPHVTLLLIDAQGEIQSVLNGVRDSDDLKLAFQDLAQVMNG